MSDISNASAPPSVEALYRAWAADLIRQLRREFAALAQHVEDAVQHAFLKACEHWPLREAKQWIARVARNFLLDVYRRGRRMEVNTEATLRLADVPDEDREAELALEEERQAMLLRLVTVKTRVSERSRQLLEAWYERGMSYQEIAATFGLSVGSVGTTLTRARKEFALEWRRYAAESTAGGENE